MQTCQAGAWGETLRLEAFADCRCETQIEESPALSPLSRRLSSSSSCQSFLCCLCLSAYTSSCQCYHAAPHPYQPQTLHEVCPGVTSGFGPNDSDVNFSARHYMGFCSPRFFFIPRPQPCDVLCPPSASTISFWRRRRKRRRRKRGACRQTSSHVLSVTSYLQPYLHAHSNYPV